MPRGVYTRRPRATPAKPTFEDALQEIMKPENADKYFGKDSLLDDAFAHLMESDFEPAPEPIIEDLPVADPEPIPEPPPVVALPDPPKQEAAPKAASVVSAKESCAMIERKWRGYPVWQCPKCRVDTLDAGLAKAARRACQKK